MTVAVEMAAMGDRRAGVLLHVTALPGGLGMGDFGPAATDFVDFLASAGQGIWQVLPLAPTGPGNSPYSSAGAFAISPVLISPQRLVQDGLVSERDLAGAPAGGTRVDFVQQARWREAILDIALDAVWPGLTRNEAFLAFCHKHAWWLDDFALFQALKRERDGAPWYSWERSVRLRHPQAMDDARRRLGFWIQRERCIQYLAWHQWQEVLAYAQERGVLVMGDVPIYVSLDSSDVWANQRIFQLDGDGRPIFCAGAPPDYFSATGQMWGNPVYDWPYLASTGYAWWVGRMEHEARRAHVLRLDHFRGFCAFWQVPACDPTAENGVWIPGPGRALFHAVAQRLPGLQLVAEDLGVITEDVRHLMDALGLPGMRVLQFAFGGGPENPYLPHHIPVQSVVYTGTHDNNTTLGWWQEEASAAVREHVEAYVGHSVGDNAPEALVRLALMSPARWAVVPLQDFLGLGSQARFNTPGQAWGNWEWCAPAGCLTAALSEKIRSLTVLYGREVYTKRPGKTQGVLS